MATIEGEDASQTCRGIEITTVFHPSSTVFQSLSPRLVLDFNFIGTCVTSVVKSDRKILVKACITLCVLKLEKRAFQHVLWVDVLHAQEIEYHVVCQVKRRIEVISLALELTMTGRKSGYGEWYVNGVLLHVREGRKRGEEEERERGGKKSRNLRRNSGRQREPKKYMNTNKQKQNGETHTQGVRKTR